MTAELTYETVRPVATYAPWLEDRAFSKVKKQIADHTLVDFLRLYELWRMVPQAGRLQGDILEVGVWRGGTGCLMAKHAQMLGLSAKVMLCDTFAGVVKAGDRDRNYVGGEHADASEDVVRALVDRMGLKNVQILKGIFPDETGHWIADRKFSLCHIDVDVYESALAILKWVWPRMPVGGVIVYDDYGFDTCSGITRHVNELFNAPGCLTVHNLNGHAVLVKTGV